MTYVTIRRDNDSKVKGKDWEALTISNNKISFLQEPLLRSLDAQMKKTDQGEYWSLCFFRGSEFEVKLFVCISQNELDKSNCDAKAIWQNLSEEKPNDESVKRASQWLRGSSTLTIDAYKHKNNRYLAIDGSGISMISTFSLQSTFMRSLLLLSLATAYRIRMEALTNELAYCKEGSKELTRLAAKASKFNAKHYFRHPVALKNIELPYIWDEIASRMRINEQDDELNQQLTALYQIVNEIQISKENNRWQLISLALGVISAVQVIGLIPESIREKWMEYLLSFFSQP